MSIEREWWFDGDYSECYYAWGHVDKAAFAAWVLTQEDDGQTLPLVENIEYLWAVEDDDDEDRFTLSEVPEYEVGKEPKPITRYQP